MSEEQVPPTPPDSPPPSEPPSPPGPPPPPEPPSPPGPPAPPPPPSAPPPASSSDPTQRSLMIALAYLGPFAFIPYLTEQGDPEIQWHAKHGLVLFGAEIVGIFLPFMVISSIPFLNCIGCVMAPMLMLVSVAILAFHVFCIVKGIQGERVKVPVLSDYADSF